VEHRLALFSRLAASGSNHSRSRIPEEVCAVHEGPTHDQLS
jgi:hypothetical protein